jgi:hypothetical protein
MKPEINQAHFKISLKQMAVYRITGAGTEYHKQRLNKEINWRGGNLKLKTIKNERTGKGV